MCSLSLARPGVPEPAARAAARATSESRRTDAPTAVPGDGPPATRVARNLDARRPLRLRAPVGGCPPQWYQAEASRRVDNPALLGALPDLGVDVAEIVANLEAARAAR